MDEQLIDALEVLMRFHKEVMKLHAPTEDGAVCQYCEDDYPCRTVRVATGEEQVATAVNTNPPTLDEIEELVDSQGTITIPKVNTAGEWRSPKPSEEFKKMSLNKCYVCDYYIEKDQERTVSKDGSLMRSKHKTPEGCTEAMRRYKKRYKKTSDYSTWKGNPHEH